MKKRNLESEDYWKAYTPEQWHIMRVRCLTSGCQYGIEGLDQKPKDRCIWCGEKRPEGHFEGISVPDLVKRQELSKLKEK